MRTIIIAMGLLISLESCTETIYEEIIKEVEVVKDSIRTVYIDRVRVDSVAYPVFKTDTLYISKTITRTETDTVYLPSDTVYIDRIVEVIVYDTVFVPVHLYDTIHVVQHHYHDTLFVPLGWSSTYIGPYLGSVEEFYSLLPLYGLESPGGDILIDPWTYQEAPPDSRSSYSNMYFDQFILNIRDDISPDEAYTAVMRELAHWQLGKPYTKEPDDILNPDFDWTRLKLSDSDAKKKPYLDRLFSKEPI